MGDGACGNCSSSDSGLIFTPQPFPSPHKPQPLCERKLGFVVPVLLGTRSREEEGAGKSSGFRVNTSPKGKKAGLVAPVAISSSVVIPAKQILAKLCIVAICV